MGRRPVERKPVDKRLWEMKMKKYFKVLLLLIAVLCLCACGKEEESNQNKCPVYYVSNSETKVEMHEHVMEAVTAEEQLQELLDCLGTMPEKLEYKAPLAMGFEVLKVEEQEGKVLLNLSQGYLKLPATTEVLVRAAIVRTLTQLEHISYVGITVEGNQLFDNAGDVVSWMSADQFIDNDGNEINTYEQTKVKLYFANETGDKLIAAYREKHYSTNTPLERFVVEELIAGPSGQIAGLYPTVNPGTKILSVMTKDGICYVNLDSSFMTAVNNVSIDIAVYSIVNSLVELSSVNKVQILINGEVPSTFSTSTFERNWDCVTTLQEE